MQKPWKCLKRVVSGMKTRFTYKWDRNVTERRKNIKRRRKRCRDGNELRKKKIENNEGTKEQEDVVVNLNKLSYQFASSKGDHEIGGGKAKKVMWLKTLKKAKKRHLEDYVEEAGSATEKQRKRVRLDPLVLSKNGENKKNRKHHRKKKVRKERCCDDERKDGNELRMKKIEDKEVRDDVAETLNKSKNNFKSGKGDHKTDKSEVKTLKKAKKRHHEDDVERAGSDSKKQHKRVKPNTLVLSTSTCGKCKKKRKHKSPSLVPEQSDLWTATKYKLQQNYYSKDRFCEMDEKAESDNVLYYFEPSVLDKSLDYFLRSRTENVRESRKKKKKKKEKRKEGKTTGNILTEGVDSNEKIETLPTHIHKDKVKSSHRNRAKNKHVYLEQSMLEVTGDPKAFHETSNDLEVRNKINGKRKKKKKKRKIEERSKGIQEVDKTDVDHRKVVLVSRAEMTEKVQEPKIKEKQKKKMKKRKGENSRQRVQELAMGELANITNDNILDGKEFSNPRVEMTESKENQKDNEKLRQADIIHQIWSPSKEQVKVLKENGTHVNIFSSTQVKQFIYFYKITKIVHSSDWPRGVFA